MYPLQVLRLALAFLLLAPGLCAAQNRQPNSAAGPQRQNFTLEGKLQGMPGGLLQVVNAAGEPWLVKVETGPENITYQALAHPTWLQPGMFVQFKGSFDPRGKATEPVSQLTIFTPKADTQLGAFPDSGSRLGGELFANTRTQPKAKPQPEVASYSIVGRVAGWEHNKLRVAAGNATVETELADDATIDVELSNYALARVGDKVSVTGWYVQKGQGWANRILVRAAQPLGAPKKERVVVSSEERKKAFDALDDLSAGDTQAEPAVPAKEPVKTAAEPTPKATATP